MVPPAPSVSPELPAGTVGSASVRFSYRKTATPCEAKPQPDRETACWTDRLVAIVGTGTVDEHNCGKRATARGQRKCGWQLPGGIADGRFALNVGRGFHVGRGLFRRVRNENTSRDLPVTIENHLDIEHALFKLTCDINNVISGELLGSHALLPPEGSLLTSRVIPNRAKAVFWQGVGHGFVELLHCVREIPFRQRPDEGTRRRFQAGLACAETLGSEPIAVVPYSTKAAADIRQ